MKSTYETSFGARLRRVQDIIQYAKGWQNYTPPRTEESIPIMEALIEQAVQANMAETTRQTLYTQAVTTRQQSFLKKTGSIDKLLSPICGAVEANYGKKSAEMQQITTITRQIRSTKAIKTPANTLGEASAKTISQSQRSYGSITQYFADMVTALTMMPGYKASNPALSVESLNQKLEELRTNNNNVATALQDIQVARAKRTDVYTELSERVKRIKAYVKSQYGFNSPQFKSISGLRV